MTGPEVHDQGRHYTLAVQVPAAGAGFYEGPVALGMTVIKPQMRSSAKAGRMP